MRQALSLAGALLLASCGKAPVIGPPTEATPNSSDVEVFEGEAPEASQGETPDFVPLEEPKAETPPPPAEEKPPAPPKPPEDIKREESFVAAKATKDMDVVVSVETGGSQREIARMGMFLTALAAKTDNTGANMRRVFMGTTPKGDFPGVFDLYQGGLSTDLMFGRALPTIANAFAIRDSRVTPRATAQLSLVVVSSTDTGRIGTDYPSIVLPPETLTFGFLKLNQPDPNDPLVCGTQRSVHQDDVIKKSGGRTFDLCDSNIDTATTDIASTILRRNRVFTLKGTPNFKKAIQVFVNDQLVAATEYVIREATLTLEFRPSREFAAGDKVKVVYVVN